jgi:predicted N-formylglutamate amidohydrolase
MLLSHEPEPVGVINEAGGSPFFLVCEHAGRRLPRALGGLGLPPEALATHIAWDIGAGALAVMLSAVLDATLVVQHYSRLVIDCNRPPLSAESIPEKSEQTIIRGNMGLSEAQKHERVAGFFTPFHDRISALLAGRRRAGRPTVLVSLHSFSPVYDGFRRPWHAGAQYNRHPDFSNRINALLGQDENLCVGDNQPYPVNNATHYTIPVHGEKGGFVHTMIEIRNDQLGDEAGQRRWAGRLGGVLTQALEQGRPDIR